MKEMFPIEPLNMDDVADLLPTGALGDSYELLGSFPVSESRKWSSLAIALFMHCALAAAIFAAGKPQPPSRHGWIEVQLVESPEGKEGAGSGAPVVLTETSESGSKAEKLEPNTPLSHEPVPSALPKEDHVLEKPPVTVPERMKAPSAAHLKKRESVKKKNVKDDARFSEEHHEVKLENNGDTTAGSINSNVTAVGQGQGAGASSGAGSSPPSELPGKGMGGPGGGVIEAAFGSARGPRFLHKVVPVYPAFARRQEMEGAVLLRVTIDEEGRAVNVEIMKQAGFRFDEAAVKAIRESTFIPAKRDGRSCSCKALLPIRFELKSLGMD